LKKILLSFIVIILISNSLTLHVYGEQILSDIKKKELIEKVDKLLKEGDNVNLRRNVNDVFLLGDIYSEEGEDKKAINLFTEALKVDAWRLEYQLKLAKLLTKNKEVNQAMQIAKIVYELAEEEKLVVEAEELLNNLDKNLLGKLKEKDIKQKKEIEDNIEIIIVPIGDVNKRLLSELREHLEKNIGIKFSFFKKELQSGNFDRSYAVLYVKKIFENITSSLSSYNIEQLLHEVNLKKSDVDIHEGKIKLIKTYFNKIPEGDKILKEFETNLKNLESEGQYDVDRIIGELRNILPIDKKSKIKGYLGITEVDLFGCDSNFLFAGAIENYGVVSYLRFKAIFNGETQNRHRLLERTLKQSLSSTLFILGIPRCITPNCVHGYPNNLYEHDQKSVEMCTQCSDRLNSYIKHNLDVDSVKK